MAAEEIQKEPRPPDTRFEPQLPMDDGNRFRRQGAVPNRTAVAAFWLGLLSLFSLQACLWLPVLGRIMPFAADLLYCLLTGLQLLLGAAALAFGVMGLRQCNRHPTVDGRGYATFGILSGTITSLSGLFSTCFLLACLSGGMSV